MLNDIGKNLVMSKIARDTVPGAEHAYIFVSKHPVNFSEQI